VNLRTRISITALALNKLTDWVPAHTTRAEEARRADIAASTAVAGVRQDVDAHAAARNKRVHAVIRDAHPLVAVRCRFRADVAASTAVVRIGTQVGAHPVATVERAVDALVNACSLNACAILIRASQVASDTAPSTVFHVIGEVGAVTAATGLADIPAVDAAGPAVRVGSQVAAYPAASRGLATDKASAISAQAGRVAVACLAGRETLIPLCLGTPIAKGFAWVRPGSPGGSQRAEHCAGDSGPQQAERLAAGNRLG
jgi:hypothetical protein